MKLKKGRLRSFNSGNYTATVQLAGSYKVYLEDISVARNIPSAEMISHGHSPCRSNPAFGSLRSAC